MVIRKEVGINKCDFCGLYSQSKNMTCYHLIDNKSKYILTTELMLICNKCNRKYFNILEEICKICNVDTGICSDFNIPSYSFTLFGKEIIDDATIDRSIRSCMYDKDPPVLYPVDNDGILLLKTLIANIDDKLFVILINKNINTNDIYITITIA